MTKVIIMMMIVMNDNCRQQCKAVPRKVQRQECKQVLIIFTFYIVVVVVVVVIVVVVVPRSSKDTTRSLAVDVIRVQKPEGNRTIKTLKLKALGCPKGRLLRHELKFPPARRAGQAMQHTPASGLNPNTTCQDAERENGTFWALILGTQH